MDAKRRRRADCLLLKLTLDTSSCIFLDGFQALVSVYSVDRPAIDWVRESLFDQFNLDSRSRNEHSQSKSSRVMMGWRVRDVLFVLCCFLFI